VTRTLDQIEFPNGSAFPPKMAVGGWKQTQRERREPSFACLGHSGMLAQCVMHRDETSLILPVAGVYGWCFGPRRRAFPRKLGLSRESRTCRRRACVTGRRSRGNEILRTRNVHAKPEIWRERAEHSRSCNRQRRESSPVVRGRGKLSSRKMWRLMRKSQCRMPRCALLRATEWSA
jgi:hypothetical protein